MDATGTLNTFTRDKDPAEFSAAACNLGLLGVIYSYTLRVEPMFNLSVVGISREGFFPVPSLSQKQIYRMTNACYHPRLFHSRIRTPF